MKYYVAQGVLAVIFYYTPITAFPSTYYDCIKGDGSITYRAEPCQIGEKESRHFQVNLERFDSSKNDSDGHASSNPENLNQKRINQNIAIPTTRENSLPNTNASPITEQDRKAKIEMVASWYANMAQDPGTKLLEDTDTMATQLTLKLGSGTNDWGPSNPNWKRVYGRVRSDTQVEMEHFRTGRGHEIESLAEASFADALSMEDVSALTEFTKSNEGKRYWQLSTEVAKLLADTVSRASSGNLTKSKTPPTQEEMKSWERVLKASNGARMMLAMIDSDRHAGRDTSGFAGIGILWGMVFSAHGDEFKRLSTTYRGDLATFDTFNESPLGRRQIEALATSSMAMRPKMTEILLDFRKQVDTHQNSWKQLYASTMEVIPQPVQQQTAGLQAAVTREFRDCPNCPVMVTLPPGTFSMGSPQSEAGRVRNDESPVHEVNIRSFAIGKFEVTVGEFSLFLKERGLIENTMVQFRTEKTPLELHQEDNHPVVNVSWNEARDYTIWLSRKTGKSYRLPSEAEWEYAARSGTQSAYYWGNNPDEICEYENVLDITARSKISWASNWNTVAKCSDGYAYTAPVGSFKPNPFGLYDMLGNAQEWVADCQHDSQGLKDLTLQSDTRGIFYAFVDYYGAPSDGSVWEGGKCSTSHMVRGGTWRYPPGGARAASRGWGEQNYRGDPARGFRIARIL